MKRILLLPLVAALGFAVGACERQQSESERKAEIERQVQERLAAEHQVEQKQNLDAREAELDAREKALAEKENAPAPTMTAIPASTIQPNDSQGQSEAADSYATFYRKLEPYGSWIETGTYGYVFHPEIAQSTGWRPYTDGHWAYTDAGWTWISNERFGWATYHYGRWIRLRTVGWVWVPGEQWGPAWVSWRKGKDYVGWAPLPPQAQFDRHTGIHNWADTSYDIGPEQYSFVPVAEFGRKLTPREIVPPQRNVTIINQTTNVTNITYDHSIVVDHGPDYEELRRHSRQPIEKLRLERTNDLSQERPVIRGEVVALPTVNFRPAKPTVRPNRVTRRIDQPVVERGSTANQDAGTAAEGREKMKAEPTPPGNLPAKGSVRSGQSTSTPVGASPAPGRTTAPSVKKAKMIPVGTPAPLPSSSAHATTETSPAPAITPEEKRDLNPREKRQQQREERRQERAQRRAARQHGMSERRGETPAASAQPSPSKQAAEREHPARAHKGGQTPSPSPGSTASPTP